MHVEDGGQPGAPGSDREGEVTVDGQVVTGRETERLHRRQRVLLQLGLVYEQETG